MKVKTNPKYSILFVLKTCLLFGCSFIFFSLSAQNAIMQDAQINLSTIDCIDDTQVDPDVACPEIYDPVCGCDGVTYDNACIAQYFFGVTDYTPGPCDACDLSLEITSELYTCDGADVCFLISGGTAPYTIVFSNNDSPSLSSNLEFCLQNLPPGNYILNVTDATGCTESLELNIPVIDYFLEADITPVSCFGGQDGAIDLLIDLTTVPLSFAWTGPNGFSANTEDIDNLSAGIYSVSVSYPDGSCFGTGSFGVEEPEELTLSFEFTGDLCDDWVDGCLHINGGTKPYHLWIFRFPDVQPIDPTVDIAPNGDVSVSDAVPADIADIEPTPFYGNEICAQDIPAGNYFVVVVDENHCWDTLTIVIPPTQALSASFEITSDVCAEQVDGCLTVSGGTEPYRVYVWEILDPYPDADAVDLEGDTPTYQGDLPGNPLGITSDANVGSEEYCAQNIPAGTYLVLVLDANNCYQLLVVEIPAPNPLSLDFIVTSDPCDPVVDGCLLINGGTEPFNIHVFTCDLPVPELPQPIFHEDGSVTVDNMEPADVLPTDPNGFYEREICVEDIPDGTYYVLVDDANGCWAFLTVVIQAAGLQVEADVHNSCNGSLGSIEITSTTGGSPPYYYEWSNGVSGPLNEQLEPGIYTVNVYSTDDFCTAEVSYEVLGSEGLDLELEVDPNGNFACAFPFGGIAPYEIVWYDIQNQVYLDTDGSNCIENLAEGTYAAGVYDAAGCLAYRTFIIGGDECIGGETVINPEVIESGQIAYFYTLNAVGQAIQWQFKTGNLGWTDIPEATEWIYFSPPVIVETDTEIFVRAQIICANGDVVYSSEAVLLVLATGLQSTEQAQVRELFNTPGSTTKEAKWTSTVFPSLTKDIIQVQFAQAAAQASVSVFALDGTLKTTQTFRNVQPFDLHRFDLGAYPSGIYLIRVGNGKEVRTHKIVLQQ